MEGLSNELQRVQEPIYGEGQQAAFLGQLNQLTNQAGKNITNRLAATGASRSGSAEDQLTNLEIARGGQAANFFAQLPFMEEQARRESTANLLGQGLNFAGRGVTNQVSTTDNTSDFSFDETRNQTSQSDMDTEGPGFLRSLAGAGGELLGGLLGNNPSDPFGIFKKKSTSPGIQTSEIPLGAGQGNRLDELLNTYKVNPISFGR